MRPGMTEDELKALYARQEEREEAAHAEGARRFLEAVRQEAERGESSRTLGHLLLKRGIEPLEQAIVEWIDMQKASKGRRHAALTWIEAVTPAVAAYLALKSTINGAVDEIRYGSLCNGIADLIMDELRYRRLREKAPALFEYKLKHFHTSSYAHMARSMDHAVRTAVDKDGNPVNVDDLQLTPQRRMLLGAKLLELLVASTGLVRREDRMIPGRKHQRVTSWIVPTEETSAWLEQRSESLLKLQAIYQPMLVPPLQWAAGKRGGFRFAQKGRMALTRNVLDKEHRSRLSNSGMPIVYAALNAVQNTAWRINPAVLALVKEIHRFGGGLAGLPLTDPEPVPVRPADADTDPAVQAKWRRAAGVVKERNHLRKLTAREIVRTISTAEEVAAEDAIFFPHSLDFRGRLYPQSSYLHPQGPDLHRALLTFSQAKPVNEAGARWLALHGANCLGEAPSGKVSRMTLDERVQLIHDLTPRIFQVVEQPFENKWWAEADDPLQFYAFCVEWRNFITANAAGEEYLCSLPCSMDGSCNGLQHFAAMWQDEHGGSAVNVVPQATPQDIYQRVADLVQSALEALAGDDPVAAKLLALGVVTRKLTKRPTMTFGYGSKTYGFRSQISAYLKGLDNWPEIRARFTEFDEEGKPKLRIAPAAGLLARLIWDALHETVIKAGEGMAWMQAAARGIVKEGRPVWWTVPITGFVVRQEYVDWKEHQIRTMLAGKLVRPVVYTPTDKLNATRHRNAVAPNLIHSLDAAALMLTVSFAADQGVESFSMIHDSYGTIPADCETLAQCCRQAFVRLYHQTNIVEHFYEQFASQHDDPSKCPPPPAKGALDVSTVLASDYFFA